MPRPSGTRDVRQADAAVAAGRMKAWRISPNYASRTHSGLTWSTKRDENVLLSMEGLWDPQVRVEMAEGGDTWLSAGRLTEESKEKLAGLWAHARGSKEPLSGSHVIGDLTFSTIGLSTMVDQAFVDAMNGLDPDLFEFVPHHKVWDLARGEPPWDGPVFIANLLPRRDAYDLQRTNVVPIETLEPKNRGAQHVEGAHRELRASGIAGGLIWRDVRTRDVFCTQPARDLLAGLGVTEWECTEVAVHDDRH